MTHKAIIGPKVEFGEIVALGVSTWTIADGDSRLVREMRRTTRLKSIAEVKRWGKRNGVNVERCIEQWGK